MNSPDYLQVAGAPHLDTPARENSNQKRSSPAVLAVIFLVCLLCCGGWLWLATVFPETGWDFTEFYIAGNVPIRSLYDQAVFTSKGKELLGAMKIDYFPPYVRPAIFALPLHAVMSLPYWTAYGVFAAAQFCLYVGALFLLFRRFGVAPELSVGFGLFYPGMMGLITGQDSNGLAFLLAIGLILLLDQRDKAAGIVLGLCLYKFNLILLLPALLLVKRKYEVLRYFAGTGLLLAAGSCLVNPPAQYLTLLKTIERYTIGFSPQKMVGLRGIAYMLDQPWLFYPFAALAVCGSIWAMRRVPLPQAYAIAILGSLICAFHVNWYDAALLAVPITVAFGSSAKMPQVLSAPLLFCFPLWAFPKLSAPLIVALTIAFIAAAGRSTGSLRSAV